MIRSSPPLRLLVVIVGGWLCLRVAILSPSWWERAPDKRVTLAGAPSLTPDGVPRNAAPPVVIALASRAREPGQRIGLGRIRISAPRGPTLDVAERFAEGPGAPGGATLSPGLVPGLPARSRRQETQAPAPHGGLTIKHLPLRPASTRWSGSGFLFVRNEGSPSIAPGGTLGGSQAGARLAYQLNRGAHRPLALVARIYTPLDRPAGTEAAAGLQWQPIRALPVHMVAERRQALGREGRSAFSLTVHGGAGGALTSAIVYDVYGQAGIVGVRSRDLFADGTVRVGAIFGPVKVGVGLWGAAQPGAFRIDAGPQLSTQTKAWGANLHLSAEWRMRVTGNVSPGSGPAFTLATDF